MGNKEEAAILKKEIEKIGQQEHAAEKMEFEMGYVKGQRWKAVLVLTCGAALLLLALWFCSKTWGTNLLFISASLGKISRYYWIFFILAVIVLAVGGLMLRKRRIPKVQVIASKPQETEVKVQTNVSCARETVQQEADICPACGKERKQGKAFCIYCGYKF